MSLIFASTRIDSLKALRKKDLTRWLELCREQGEVASVTSQAARIVQRQWEDKNRERREVGTETDASLWNGVRPVYPEGRARSDSPGRAVPSR
ncbi:hypothetical protein GCK32_019362, partial [Trichostrongylus colubriformis]